MAVADYEREMGEWNGEVMYRLHQGYMLEDGVGTDDWDQLEEHSRNAWNKLAAFCAP